MGDQLQGKHILIVDDSEDMRNLMQQILEEDDDYILGFAEDGLQVLQKATEFQPDLILLDMSLPGMSGWEIVPQLRHTPNLAHIPVIAVTAHVSKADQERALALGCNAHLGKPFDIELLVETITQVLENVSRDI
jgi:two-component system, cell cycle response regulator DivK